MSFKRLLMSALAATAFGGMTTLAFADNNYALRIINDTDFNSTSKINHGACSTILGSSGTTKAHDKNDISETIINVACLKLPGQKGKTCSADIYMQDSCKGNVEATATLELDTYTIVGDVASKGSFKFEKIDPHTIRITK